MASEIAAVAGVDDLLAEAQRLQQEALGVLEFARTEGKPERVLEAIDRLQKGVT